MAIIGLFTAGSASAAVSAYVVKKGDTLCGIGAKFSILCKDMVASYPGKNPNLIHPGDKFEFGRPDGLLGGLISKPYTFVPNTVIHSSQVNSDFDTLYTLVNGNLNNANIVAGASISSTKINGTAIVSTGATYQSINGSSTVFGALIVSSTENYFRVPVMTTVQRDALTNVEAGAIIYSTTDSQFYVREGGSWAAISPAAATALANSTTKGIVEEATSDEVTAGTATGATGANLYVPATQWLGHADENITNNIDNGETIVIGNILYVSSTGKHMIAHSNVQDEVNKITTVAFESAATGSFAKALFPGSIVFDSGLTMTTGSLVYLSSSGRATTTADAVRKIIGLAYGNNTWLFSPDMTTPTSTKGAAFTPVMTSASGTITVDLIATSTTNGQILRSTSTGAYWGGIVSTVVSSTLDDYGGAEGVTYYNSSTISRLVMISANLNGASSDSGIYDVYLDTTSTMDGSSIIITARQTGGSGANVQTTIPITFIVPPGWYYKIVDSSTGSATAAINKWREVTL